MERALAVIGPAAALSLAAGCYEHRLRSRDELDGSARDAAVADADAPTDPCVTSLGWRRCSPECQTCLVGHCCGLGFECSDDLDLCFPGAGVNPCLLNRAPTGLGADLPYEWPACRSGQACAFAGDELPEPGEGGSCVPLELCFLDDPGLEPRRCFWSDGTEVTRAPPSVGCPDLVDAQACGADCPLRCSNIRDACAGLSDERGLGFCVETMRTTCGDPELDRIMCDGFYGPTASCRCLHPRTPAPTTLETFGFLVLESTCLDYAARFPEIVCDEI